MSGFDLTEFIKRIVKYLVEGIIIAVICYVIPKKSLNMEEVTVIAISASAIFAILDTFMPSVSASAKQGLGFAIGANFSGLRVM